jgi:hypothetical protein
VKDIFSRAHEWFAEHFPRANGMVELTKTAVVRDLAMRLEIRRLVLKSIREVEAEEAKKKVRPQEGT